MEYHPQYAELYGPRGRMLVRFEGKARCALQDPVRDPQRRVPHVPRLLRYRRGAAAAAGKLLRLAADAGRLQRTVERHGFAVPQGPQGRQGCGVPGGLLPEKGFLGPRGSPAQRSGSPGRLHRVHRVLLVPRDLLVPRVPRPQDPAWAEVLPGGTETVGPQTSLPEY